MSSKRAIQHVFDHLKKGKIIGTVEQSITDVPSSIIPTNNDNSKSIALKYRSYNPSLTKENFSSILPERMFGVPNNRNPFTDSFQLIKSRDPRYFQFKDYYVLLFKDHKSLTEYYDTTKLSRINQVRVKFTKLPSNDMSEAAYSHYVDNLLAAYESSEKYFEKIKHKCTYDKTVDLNTFQEKIRPIEERSALIWNLPLNMRPHDVMDKFWFYDIKHCFKLYWDNCTGKTLYYVAFNDPTDCTKFKRNFHGVYFDDDVHLKLLVETVS